MDQPNSTPVIARVAGIGSNSLEPLHWEAAAKWAETIRSLRQVLLNMRKEAAEALYFEIPHHALKERRLLLNLRRGCHNKRNVALLIPEALRLNLGSKGLPDLLQRLAGLEDKLVETQSAYESEYALRSIREVAILARPLRDSALRRGLALASPSFSGIIETLVREPGEHSGRSSREIQTLARYVTRAAFKLSPYSTLTPVALAEIKPLSSSLVRYVAGRRTTTSSLRIKRYLLDQCCEVLRRSPGVRPYLQVRVNSTVSPLGGHRFRFLRPPQLLENEGSPTLTYSRYEQVRVHIGGSLPSFLLERPEQSSLAQLISDLEAVQPEFSAEELARAIEALIELGFLSLLFPVPSYHPHFERGLLDFLTTLPPAPPIAATCSVLDEIVHLEDSYSTASAPVAIAARIESAVEDLYQAAQSGLPDGVSVPLQKDPLHNLYEDCFEISEATSTGAVLELDESALLMAVKAGNLMWQIASLHASRHELLLTLEAFMNRHLPGQDLVPVLELFDRFGPLWEEYLSFLVDKQGAIFNPLALATVSDLTGLRLRLRKRLEASLRSTEEVEYYPIAELRQMLDDLPPRWLNPLGPSLFLQPADPEGSDWVINCFFEGNGRLSSRYTTVMPAGIREHYLRHYRLRSTLDVEGETAELLDLQYTKKSTSNVHWPQTAKVLLIPGESLDPADAQAVEPRDLFVRRRPNRPLSIVNSEGHRLVPSFLSPLANQFMPSILKFLDVFGFGLRNGYSLPPRQASSRGMILEKRQQVGNLIIRRASWKFDRNVAPPPSLEPNEFFLEIQRWRADAGLPLEVYVVEQNSDVALRGGLAKPQYVRFDSITLVEMLRESLRKMSGPLVLTEAVPRAADYPQDPQLGRRAVEVIVESLALAPLAVGRSRSHEGEIYQSAEPLSPATQEVKYA
jgi:hypothetical protein